MRLGMSGGGRSLVPTRLREKFPVTGKITGNSRAFDAFAKAQTPGNARPEPISSHLPVRKPEIEQGIYVP